MTTTTTTTTTTTRTRDACMFLFICVLTVLFSFEESIAEIKHDTFSLNAGDSVQKKNNTNATVANVTRTSRLPMNATNNATIATDVSSSENMTRISTVLNATIAIYMSGELGNQLTHLAHGYSLHWWAMRRYGLNTHVIIRNQVMREGGINPKAWITRKILLQCFPNLKDMDAGLGNSKEYDSLLSQQNQSPLTNNSLLQLASHGKSEEAIGKSLEHLKLLARYSNTTLQVSPTDYISLPILEASSMNLHFYADKFYANVRELLRFDDGCCKQVPAPDETVFHYRNFVHEMPVACVQLGFEELSPRKIAQELFDHLQSGDKVAITARFVDERVEAIVLALEARGIQTRTVVGQTGIEDFCFLMKAQKELVGTARSTYALWAALLGNTPRVILYGVDSPATRGRFGSISNVLYNWTNPELKSRISFEVYKSEEMEGSQVNGTGTNDTGTTG